MKYKYLHIMPPSDRMMKGYLMMLREHFNMDKEHAILFNDVCRGTSLGFMLFPNAMDWSMLGKTKRQKFARLKKLFSETEHIVFHQFMPNGSLLAFLYMNPKFLDKIMWVIWGIDIYNYKYAGRTLKERVLNHMGKNCRSRIKIPIVLAETEIEVYNNEFSNGKVPIFAPYVTLNEMFDEMDDFIAMHKQKTHSDITEESDQAVNDGADNNGSIQSSTEAKTDYFQRLLNDFEPDEINILVGHNAHPFNRHTMILKKLERFKREKIHILCPLSYGNSGPEAIASYPTKLENYCNITMPGKATSIRKLLSKSEYTAFLSKIDIAVLGAPRQNALGNIIRLLYMGKKVFLARDDNPLYSFLVNSGMEIYAIEDIDKMSYEEFIAPLKKPNSQSWLKTQYGEERAISLWKKAFDYAEGKIERPDIIPADKK